MKFLEAVSKNTFSTEQLQTTASEFPQKNIDKFIVKQTKVQKDSYMEKKSNAWNREKRTQMLVTEGLAATDKGSGCWLFLQGSSVTDVWGVLNATLSEKVSITGATHKNRELALLPNSLDSH